MNLRGNLDHQRRRKGGTNSQSVDDSHGSEQQRRKTSGIDGKDGLIQPFRGTGIGDELANGADYTDQTEDKGVEPSSRFPPAMFEADEDSQYQAGDVDDELDDGDIASAAESHNVMGVIG